MARKNLRKQVTKLVKFLLRVLGRGGKNMASIKIEGQRREEKRKVSENRSVTALATAYGMKPS